jgi:P27 family predicted phage terminase small subunit
MLFNLLTQFDVMCLAGYCTSYQRWRTAEEMIEEMGERDPNSRALLVRGSKGQARANPLIQVSREAANDMLRFAAEFGFTPAARSRIAAGVGGLPEPPDGFDGLLTR